MNSDSTAASLVQNKLSLTPVVVAMFLAGMFLVALFGSNWLSGNGLWALFVGLGLVASVSGGIGVYRLIPKNKERFDIARATGFFILSGYVFFLISETLLARYGAIITVAGVVGIFLANLSFAFKIGEAAVTKTFIPLIATMEILASFFFAYFLYAAIGIIHLPLILATGLAAIFAAVALHYGLYTSTVRGRGVVGAWTTAIFAAEIFLALALLPTSALVNAAAFVLICNSLLFGLREILLGNTIDKWWRTIALAAGLLAVVFLTADWI